MRLSHHTSRARRQRGVALLIALFALMLLTAIGLGMMYSADTETSINFNYKDKQAAIYAANSGMEEAKDRLLQSGGDITPPSDVPKAGVANIIYLLNPASGESASDITPWDMSSKYPDTELCQENVLGLTGTNGVPCTATASGSSWYKAIDNSGHWSGILGSPLNYKWVRIQLKTNNATPWPVDGSASNGAEVCWDGLHQIPLPAGYGTSCTPQGGVTLNLTSSGSGYPIAGSPPTVTIGPPPAGGVQATATPIMQVVPGTVSSIQPNNPGSGYSTSTPPTVTIDPPSSGTQATATANVVAAGGSVTALKLSNTPNACYTTETPTLTASGGGAVQNAVANLGYTTTQCIANINFSNYGKKCSGSTMTITGGSTSATFSITYGSNGVISSASLTNPGAGYTSTPGASAFSGITCSGGGSTPPQIVPVMGWQVVSATLGNGGSGYTSTPTFTFPGGQPGSATQPLINASDITVNPANPNAGQISGYTITNPGSGYTSVPNVTVAPPVSGTTATATADTTVTQNVTGFNVVAGSGYITSPAVTISAPGGSGTTATATAIVSNGPYYSPVIMLTALGQTTRGGRSFTQMEAAYSIRSLSLPGALTMAGPQPNYGSPNSNNFYISGQDHPNGYDGTGSMNPPGCNGTATASHPAIGVYDNPNSPTTPSSVDTMLAPGVLQPAPSHYTGVNPYPDIQNVYGALGLNTPTDFDTLVANIAALPNATVIPSGTFNMGTASNPAINVNYGDMTLSGNNTGYGLLVVTGILTFKGNFMWNGLVLVIGQGNIQFSGGGGGTINGSVIIAKTKDSSGNELASLGQPTLNWSGGGGNGIYYDHCWSDAMLNSLPLTVPASTSPLKVLSVKSMSY